MKAPALDMTQHTKMVRMLENILQHRREHPTQKSEEIYWELLAKYYRRLHTAKEEGKLLAGHTVMLPQELFYAMDMYPVMLETSAVTLGPLVGKFEELFAVAKSYGMAVEICSAHRVLASQFVLGWFPKPDIIVWSNQVCDNTSKSGELLMELYNIPGFFIDRPYRFTEKEAAYLARELEELVTALEKVTGRKLDWDKLVEAMKLEKRAVELSMEIYALKKHRPCPLPNKRTTQMMFIHWLYGGTEDAVRYYEAVRDEAKALVEQGKGAVEEERFRLISLFLPPMYQFRILDWMQREHGASIVADPYSVHWGDIEWDFSQPLLTMARRLFNSPICRQMHGPVEEGVVEDSVNDALAHGAEGAIYWAHTGCRQACAAIKSVKDALAEKVGIPTLVLDIDIIDPSFVTEDELKDKLEGFFETLEERK